MSFPGSPSSGVRNASNAKSHHRTSNEGSVAGTSTSYASYHMDPTREKIQLCVANYPIDKDWMTCMAKFDTGCDDDWISEKLVSEIGIELEQAPILRCSNFDNSVHISEHSISRLTWMHDQTQKTICGTFRVGKHSHYDIIIGKQTLFEKKIYSTGDKVHDTGVLVTKKISKEEAERIQKDKKAAKETSKALWKKQDQKQKEKEAADIALKRGKSQN